MASKNKTANYGLNQWARTDGLCMADFNSDNSKIDAALTAVNAMASVAGNSKIAVGNYVGTGTSGAANPNTLTFDFVPQLVFVIRDGGASGPYLNSGDKTLTLVRGTNRYFPYGSASYSAAISWSGNSVSYYGDYQEASANPGIQMNVNGFTYHYVAIG